MKYFRLIGALMLGFGLSACAAGDTATRNAPLESPALQAAPLSLDVQGLSLIHISEPTRLWSGSRMPSSA